MHVHLSFPSGGYADEVQCADRELAAFISAVTKLYGAEQARISAKDWLDEAQEMDGVQRSARRNWRAVTIAASALLANRLNQSRRRTRAGVASDPKVSAIPSSN
jgi:hypothetical protein